MGSVTIVVARRRGYSTVREVVEPEDAIPELESSLQTGIDDSHTNAITCGRLNRKPQRFSQRVGGWQLIGRYDGVEHMEDTEFRRESERSAPAGTETVTALICE